MARTGALRNTPTTRHSANAPHRVRIIGGRWKRTNLPVVDVTGLRPTPDRVRETLFSWIEHFVPDLSAVRGVDLFAGTGALGFELASRGAARVTLVESNRQLAEQLTRIKHRLAAAEIEIVAGDALAVAARLPSASFEVVFIDPPFDSGLLASALAATARLVTKDGLIYVEAGTPVEESLLSRHQLYLARSGRAGRVHFHLLRPQSA
ncbi:MAG: 16S rRNA (guanine(966)-N(2))-methyltransferase RsmD [Burkholderiaceae bacterium]